MQNPPPPVTRALSWRRHVLVAAMMSLLGGCGTPNHDFGEVRPTLVSDGIHDWIGPYASGAKKGSRLDLTDDERQLRDLAYPLIDPPYDRQQWYSVAGEYGLYRPARRVDCAAYATWLVTRDGPSPLGRYDVKTEKWRHEATVYLSEHDRSPASRYARLLDDVRNDTTQVPQFFETGTRVLDIDQKRKKGLGYVSGISPAERNDAELRIRENAAIVTMVRDTLMQRTACYRYALGRLVIASPYVQAVDIERAIDRLKADIERYRAPAPSWTRVPSLASQ
ncbi:MAG TPA: hypothetical protein VFW22_14075 [Pseudolabrys sp.]|nr:hypothetical protein [Pseudolabrys sp.]